MKKVLSKEAKIGIVSILSLILLYFGINYLKGVNLFKPVNHYNVICNNVMGVTVSSPVYVEGFKVGLVREIRYNYETTGDITIEISLDEHMRINKGSYITIVNSFLGGGELHIHLNKYIDDYLKPGSEVEGRMETGMMQAVEHNILPQVEVLLPKIDSILGGIQTLVNHPALAQTFTNMEQATSRLATSSKQLSSILGKDLPLILTDLQNITGNFSSISTNLNKIDFNQTMHAVNTTLANVEQLTRQLNSKDNSMGLLLNDRGLYDNLNSTAENASKLLLDLRQNPKRYVHFSVF